MRLKTVQLIYITVICSALLGVTIWALYFEYNRPWKQYQKEFAKLEHTDIKKPAIEPKGEKIQQLLLQELGEVDRCITCHQAADKPGFNNVPQPFKTHSGDYLKHHPIEKYGCVVCHEGQGPALTVDTAHGEAKNWAKPILRGSLVQSSCGKCHFMEQGLPLSSELSGATIFSYGWKLFQEYNCSGCHKLKRYKRPDRVSPALTNIGSKITRDWLMRWLKDPRGYIPETKMPRFKLSDEEIEDVTDFLMSLKSSPLNSPLGKGGNRGGNDIEEGGILVNSLGCLGCHRINDKGNDFGPDFTDIGNKVELEWLYKFLEKPMGYDPRTIIPDFVIPEKDIPKIAAYLMSLKKDKENMIEIPLIPTLSPNRTQPTGQTRQGRGGSLIEEIEKGKKLVKDLGCTGCHETEKLPVVYNAPDLDGIGEKRVEELFFGNITNVEKTLIDWLLIKVTDPGKFSTDRIVTRMPNYNFNKKQAEALVTFLLSLRKDSVTPKYLKTLINPEKAEMRGKKVFEKYNCLGCHRINKEGGDIGPELTIEAKKSRPEWLFAFLKKPLKVRPEPILNARMPDFNLSDKEIGSIIEYFAFVSGESFPYNFEPKKDIYSDDIWNGEKLYHEVFACSGCHVVNGRGGEVGPDHTDLASRLKREWIEQWLQNPYVIKPDVRMPRYKFKGWEFEALTNYLMTLGQYRFVQIKKDN